MKQQIIEDIHHIRKVLESFSKRQFPVHSSFYQSSTGFPKGCCKETTHLLALFLKQKYNKHCDYVAACGLGDKANQSHVWLICENYLIDITADQFLSRGYDVSAVMITKNSKFHRLFDRVDNYQLNTEDFENTAISYVLKKVLNKLYCNNL